MPNFDDFQHVRVERDDQVVRVILNRPKVHNAFGPRLIEELGAAFTRLNEDEGTRVIVLTGDGPSFSAGADINWMRDSVDFTRQQNVEDATRLALMLQAIDGCDKPVVCRVQGSAIGGALGLISASDYVVCSDTVKFAFSEVKLGLVPAVISPFVLRRMGIGSARALFITGERFSAQRAYDSGLIHVVVPPEELDAEVDRVVGELLSAAPEAIAIAKRLAHDVVFGDPRTLTRHTAETIATRRTDPEGQEGLSAFLEKRKPSWHVEHHATTGHGSKS